MDLWRILVFMVVTPCRNREYDALRYRTNHNRLLRRMLDHGAFDFDSVRYKRPTLKDNVQRIMPTLLAQVNALVVSPGHKVAGRCGTGPV